MSPGDEIDYGALADCAIKDFESVKRLWAPGTRLLSWIVLEVALVALTILFLGTNAALALIYPADFLLLIGLSICASVASAFLALRGAVPGREVTWRELTLLIAVVCGTVSVGFVSSPIVRHLAESLRESTISILDFFALAAVPWLALFWAVRRGVPLQPAKTGALVGLAASCWAFADHRFISEAVGWPNQAFAVVFAGIFITIFSAVAGVLWLDWIARWQDIPARLRRRPQKASGTVC